MAGELGWSRERCEVEWKESISFLGSMGLPKGKLELTRKDVEAGRVGKVSLQRYLFSLN